MNDILLEMKNISKSFPGVRALDDVSLKVRRGTVHALMGENGAGKSTLMKCLFGIYHADSGEIFLEGKKVQFRNSKDALENGVAMVHQELNQALKRNITDNLWLGRYPTTLGFVISEKKMYEETMKIFDNLGIDEDPHTVMSRLSVSKRQMVEIAKAVSYNSKIIVFDEPTSSLTETEAEHLFRIIDLLKKRGAGIIYISHKMEEILKISDDVTVMRDGKYVATEEASELTTDKIIKLMVGRELTNRFPPKSNTPGKEIINVKNLSGAYSNVKDVSFSLREGEILGIAGLAGAGRSELLETIFGIAKKKSRDRSRKKGRQPFEPSGYSERICSSDGRTPRDGNFRDSGYYRKHHDIKSQELPKRRDIFKLVENEKRYDVGCALDENKNFVPKNENTDTFRRKSAEGHPWKVAAYKARDTAPRRADARHRCGCEIRNISADNRSCRERKKRYYGIFRNAGAARSMRPHTRNVRRTCRGRASGTDNAGRNNGVIRQIRLTLRNASSN